MKRIKVVSDFNVGIVVSKTNILLEDGYEILSEHVVSANIPNVDGKDDFTVLLIAMFILIYVYNEWIKEIERKHEVGI